MVVGIPVSLQAGTHFEARVGLYTTSGPRAQLTGFSDDQHRLRLAAMDWTGAAVSWKPIAVPPNPFSTRFNQDGRPITFDQLTTTGAVRITNEPAGTFLTPLPGGGAFEIRLHVGNAPRVVEALSESGGVLSRPALRFENGAVVIERDPAVFAYRLME